MLLAQETDGFVTLFNWNGEEHRELFSYDLNGRKYDLHAVEGYDISCSAYAYENGYLYCIYSIGAARCLYRINMETGEEYVYACNGRRLNSAGVAAEFDTKNRVLRFESPELGAFEEVTVGRLNGRYNSALSIMGWYSDDTLLFWAYNDEAGYGDTALMYCDVSTGACGVWLDESGSLIAGAPYICDTYNFR